MNQLSNILEPFFFLTESLSGEKYVSMPLVLPQVKVVQQKLAALTSALLNQSLVQLRNDLRDQLHNFWSTSTLADPTVPMTTADYGFIACYLDPRFKNMWFINDPDGTTWGPYFNKLTAKIREEMEALTLPGKLYRLSLLAAL